MQEWIHGPFNFHEIKQNQNPLHRACSFTSFHRIILKITSRVRTNVRLLIFLKKIITHFWCKQASLLHHTRVKQISACTNGYVNHLIFMEQKNIKTRYGAFKLNLFMGFQSTYFRYNWMRDYLISTQQNKVKIRFRACKLHSSSQSNQYDFIMHKRRRRLFNFHETKENQNTLWCI